MRSEAFRKMVEQSPDNRLFRFSLGQALYEEGLPSEAIEHLRACCEHQAEWMMPRILLGKAYMQLGQREQAREVFEAALALAIEQNHEAPEMELRAFLEELEE